jgi:hypothetical protein
LRPALLDPEETVIALANDCNRGGQDGGGFRCFVDFPCFGRLAQCLSKTSIQRMKTVSCENVICPGACCGHPCSGAACRPAGPAETCPQGTACRDVPASPGSPLGDKTAECVAVEDDAGQQLDAALN